MRPRCKRGRDVNMLITKIMGKFKMQTSKQINIARNTAGRKNWQTDYDDRIIRNDAEYQSIVEYIRNNPGACECVFTNKT